MNLFYPDFLRRIDHYLKINYPHVWRTRVHDFGWFSLILGNVVAATFGMLIVGRGNVTEGSVKTMHISLAVLLGFVVLFWAMLLLRYKIKFSNFKTMLATWVIYVLCVASLGLNLATFTSSIAYRTACLYSDEMIQADYDFINNLSTHVSNFDMRGRLYEGTILNPEYVTDELLIIMRRHGYHIDTNKAIHSSHIETVKKRIKKFVDAKFFVQQPILKGDLGNLWKRTAYHNLLMRHWKMLITILLFLPTILFLISIFGIKNILISAFCTGLIVGLTDLTIESFGLARNLTIGVAPASKTYVFITSVLMFILLIGRHRLQSWNYIAGVFMLMLGVVFLKYPALTGYYILIKPGVLYSNPWTTPVSMLCASLLVSLIAAWLVMKHNKRPILR